MAAKQLLLVEDDPQIVRAILPALEVCGHLVTVARDGASALRHLRAQNWDALVVDLGLPDMDGKTVVRQLRESSLTPAIVISARHSPQDRLDCAAAGANEFVSKPFTTPQLMSVLKAAMSS